MPELVGKRVVVVGLGRSGLAAARLCLRRGARVVATDDKPRGALPDEVLGLEALGATLVAGEGVSQRCVFKQRPSGIGLAG